MSKQLSVLLITEKHRNIKGSVCYKHMAALKGKTESKKFTILLCTVLHLAVHTEMMEVVARRMNKVGLDEKHTETFRVAPEIFCIMARFT